jgi:hypothetical protein
MEKNRDDHLSANCLTGLLERESRALFIPVLQFLVSNGLWEPWSIVVISWDIQSCESRVLFIPVLQFQVCNGCGSHGANAVVSWDDIQSCVFSYSSEKEVCVFGRILGAAATQSRGWKRMGSFAHEQGFEDFCLSLSLHTHQNCNL